MDDDQQFCLRWNNHQSTLVSVFDTLLEKGIHVDCTLAAEGQTLKAHKVVLSACSPYFENVLSQQFDKHPIIILKDVKYAELRAMMDYMYRGEVNISQDQLAALLKAAESLQIKGLSDNKPSRPPSRPPPPAAAAPPAAPAPPAVHPPRTTDTQTKVIEGSIDSREGSVSPTRRRKKARRMSTESIPIPPANDNAQGNGDEAQCKEEVARDGMDDLTIDEDNDEQAPVTHNDVVRNFQWHMERSQDEMINSNDSVRDSQGPSTRNIVTRSKQLLDESDRATTFAILKPANKQAKKPEPKEKTEQVQKVDKPVQVALDIPKPKVKPDDKVEIEIDVEDKDLKADKGVMTGAVPLGRRRKTSCAQYKTEKGYQCPNCSRCYNARKNLVRHITLECGRDPQYKCPVCLYSKHRRNELNNHIKRKHPSHPLARELAKQLAKGEELAKQLAKGKDK